MPRKVLETNSEQIILSIFKTSVYIVSTIFSLFD